MKKGILAVLLVALMALPLAAMAGMLTEKAPVSDNVLEGVTGQTGVTINASLEVTGGWVAWGDDDGDKLGTSGYTTGGFFTLSGLTINNGGAGTAMDMDGLTIDVGNDGTNTALIIGLPQITGDIGFGSLRLGTAANTGTSLGSLTIGDLTTNASTIEIYAH